MFRVNRSPDQPMFQKRDAEAGPSRPDEVVLCVNDSARLQKLLGLVPAHTVRVETNLSRALQACLENRVSRLLVDMASCGATALSCLVQLRLMRPQQEIVLFQGQEERMHLDQTLLGDVPVLSVRYAAGPEVIPLTAAAR